MVDRTNGRAVSSATFASRNAMVASRKAAEALRTRIAEDVGATVTDIHEFELALAHLHVRDGVSDAVLTSLTPRGETRQFRCR